MAEPTIFSKIIDGEIPGDFVYEDELVVAIRDIEPAAPIHILVIPRKPVASLQQLHAVDHDLAARLLFAVGKIAKQEGIEDGYRVIINTGVNGGQTVPHLHLHVLGGKKLNEEGMVPDGG